MSYVPPPYGQPYGYPGAYPHPYAPGPPPLDLPHYGIGPVDAVKRAFRKYARFDGRAGRSEYWWWVLFLVVAFTVLTVPGAALAVLTSPDGGQTPGWAGIVCLALTMVLWLGTVVPSIAVTVRRLHDAGYSGWFYLFNLIPYIGGLVLVIFLVQRDSPQGVRYDRYSAR